MPCFRRDWMSMHLSKKQSERFYKLIYPLAEFVVSQLANDGNEFENVDFEEELLLHAFECIALHPSYIDGFIASTELDLSQADENVLQQWKHPLTNFFQVKEYAPNGNAIIRTPFGLVSVVGITQEISDLIPDVPAFAKMTLLPFEDKITYAVHIIEVPIVFGDGLLTMMEGWDESDKDEEPVSFSQDYVPKLLAYLKQHNIEEMEELERQIQRESDKANGALEPEEGFHRGVLAGLTPQERKAAIDENFDSVLKEVQSDAKESIRQHALFRAIHHAPEQSLMDCIVQFIAWLDDAVKHDDYYESHPFYGLSIPECVDEALDTSLLYLLCSCDADILKNIRTIYEQQSPLVFSASDDDLGKKLTPAEPLLFLFYDEQDEQFDLVMPQEISEKLEVYLEDTPWIGIENLRDMLHKAKEATAFAAELYGIIEYDKCLDIVAQHIDADSILVDMLLRIAIWDGDTDFEVIDLDDVNYIVYWQLTQEFMLEGGPEEGIDDAEALEALDVFRSYIFDRQQEIEFRPLPDEYSNYYESITSTESAQQLIAWLDEHIPDGEQDFSYADNVIEQLVDTRRFSPEPAASVHVLEDMGSLPDDFDDMQDLLSLVMRFINDIPLWQNAGWSSTQLLENETGRKLFFNDDGTPMKVGRNDPCPCGSGKKYKKCCGKKD